MTWTKLGTEFFDQLVDMSFPDDLDDACQLTHAQAIHYCYSVESMSLRFKKSVLRRFATSSKSELAARALVNAGAWADRGNEYELIHHEAVVRQSLGYQLRERDRARKKMQAKRSTEETADVPQDVPQDVPRNDVRTQTDRQTFRQRPDDAQPDERIDERTGEVLSDPFPPPRVPPAAAADPWTNQPTTYPKCSVPGCSERLLSVKRQQSGVCFNHQIRDAS